MKYQVMPDLTPIEYEALKADIAERGVLVPVEVDETGAILDGHHRVRAWNELRNEGVNLAQYPQMVRRGLTEEQKRNHARSLNVLRRHLSRDQRDDVMRQMRADGATYKEIAGAVGVSHQTAMRAASDVNVHLDIENERGQTRPSTYAPRTFDASVPSLFVPGGSVTLEPKAAEQIVKQAQQERTAKRAYREDVREQRRQDNAEKVASCADSIPSGARFATILIDPPWDWSDEGDVNQMGRAKPDYNTLTIDELLALPVADLADTDCHIYLWITNRSLPKGFSLLERWGFRYVTCVTWVKPYFGMGNYFRGQTEHILFGVKGSQPLRRHDVGTVFSANRGPNGHSSKPPEIYSLIESCSPGPYLEMFSRCNRNGWVTWGENGNS